MRFLQPLSGKSRISSFLEVEFFCFCFLFGLVSLGNGLFYVGLSFPFGLLCSHYYKTDKERVFILQMESQASVS